MTPSTIHAPAKLNLGLEILGKRDDGFHEIRSVLATTSLCDTLTFSPATGPKDHLVIHGTNREAEILHDQNLVLSALQALRQKSVSIPPQHIDLTKRIPIAAGLGGASTDAAATLRFFASHQSIAEDDLSRIASSLGSDVPFFLGSPFAIVRGRGDEVFGLPAPHVAKWAVTVTPDVSIPAKTATMYKAVDPGFWSSGHHIEQFAASFPNPSDQLPSNAFAQALFARFPTISATRDALIDAGFPFVAVSGAGPTLFTLCDSKDAANEYAHRASQALPSGDIHVSRLGAALTLSTDLSDRRSD